MGLFDRNKPAPRERTRADRERARAEREARRNGGAPPPALEIPPGPPAPGPPGPAPDPSPPTPAPDPSPPSPAPDPSPPTPAPDPSPPPTPAPGPSPLPPGPGPQIAAEQRAAFPPPPEAARRAMRRASTRPDPATAFLDQPPTDRWDEVGEPEPEPEPASVPASGTDSETSAPAAEAPRRASFLERATSGDLPDGAGGSPPAKHRGTRGGGGVTPGRILAVGAVLLVGLLVWFVFSLFQPGKGDGKGQVTVVVPRGASVDQIATLLHDKGVIAKPFFFKLRARLAGKRNQLKPGTYVLAGGMSYGKAIDALSAGPPPPKRTKITITEGRSRAEISGLLKKTSLRGNYYNQTKTSPLLSPRSYGAPKGVNSLEGFLFPATYDVRQGGPVKNLIDQQIATFKSRFNQVDLRVAKKKNLTAYDVLIIASMVEREAQLDRERPIIAGVIYNRLKQGIPLGIDSTTRYAINNYTRALRQSDFTRSGAYNTRAHKGLPPTPIGNPGIASIQAAAHPRKVPYIYFVVKPGRCGEHAFSSTDAQFQRDSARYSTARSAAGNRSPTTCK
jgi:UPF0755 protein